MTHDGPANTGDEERVPRKSGSRGYKNDENLPRVLFVSVNPFSDTSNNGKTFASFFRGYPKESLAQLYFHREIPSSPVCDRYYRITDEHLLGGLFAPRRVTGERVGSQTAGSSPIPQRAHSALKQSRTARLLRQLLWTRVRLDNKQLEGWLDEFGPQVIVFCGGDAASLYPKVTAMAARFNSKIVLYITDDYVLPSRSRNMSAQLMRRWTRRSFKKLASQASLIMTIGQSMTDVYRAKFGVESEPFMNMVDVPASMPHRPPREAPDEPFTLLYAGSLHSNRWKVLAEISESVRRLSEAGTPTRLKIFGPDPTGDELSMVQRPPYSTHEGLLSPKELAEAIWDADALVHVEASDPDSMEVTALSLSTKIPEYLSSGKCVVAAGPTGVASIRYLAEHNAAIILDPTVPAALDAALHELISSEAVRDAYARRAFELAVMNHDGVRMRAKLWSRLEEIAG